MPKAGALAVLLAMAPGGATARLRAALMLLGQPPRSLAHDALAAALQGDAGALAFAEVADGERAGGATTPPTAWALATALLRPLRARVVLVRPGGAAVSRAERDWAAQAGFAGWWTETDRCATGSEGAVLVGGLLAARGVAVAPSLLSRVDTVAGVHDTAAEQPRRHVRTLTGLAAEAWGASLARSLPLADRSWRLRTYPHCAIGRDIVSAWCAAHGLARGEAVVLGRAAVALGLLRHVVDEHDFDDAELFYAVDDPSAHAAPPLVALLGTLKAGVEVADRRWHGRVWERCWVGQEGVEALAPRLGGDRRVARLALARLMRLGAFVHVAGEQPLRDGEFFYRFAPEVPA